MNNPRALLHSAFQAALAAANPLNLLPPHLPRPPHGKTLITGGGKAAAAMAKAVETHWPLEAPLSGLVVTRYEHGLPTQRIEVLEASHPLPDGHGTIATQRMLDGIRLLTPDDLLIVLLSGGGSSLLALPVDGVSLGDLRSVTNALLACGAPIQDINTVRKHLTQFSAGQVAALSAAPVLALIISDVVGGDPAHIASGPCAPDPGTFADAIGVLERYAIAPPSAVIRHLRRGLNGLITDTPKPGDAFFRHVENRIIGSARLSLAAASAFLSSQGIQVFDLGELEGEARDLAKAHAQFVRGHLADSPRPFALLSGGESTVKVTNPAGRGGRNTDYLLALGMALEGVDNVYALACDTDGIDGTEDNAGAIWMANTAKRAALLGLDAETHLEANDAYDFFLALGDLVVTNPTRTNVNDFRLVLAV